MIVTAQDLKGFISNRSYFPQPWNLSLKNLEVIAFGDASPLAYGAVVYIRTKHEGKYMVSFCVAKTRVAPVKEVTLPRLELLAALLAARLSDYVRNCLMIPEARTMCYTDSTIVLHWIKKVTILF